MSITLDAVDDEACWAEATVVPIDSGDVDNSECVEIIDIAGKVIVEQIALSNSTTINVSLLKPGLYIVKANVDSNAIQKIFKF